MKIFVRFGHDILRNGSFTGAPGTLLSERDVIESYAPWVAQELYYAGHDVMTYSTLNHPDDAYATANEALIAGIREAKNWEAELFVSCHANSADDSSASYSSCCHRNDSLSRTLATAVSKAAADTLGIRNTGAVLRSDLAETSSSMNMSSIIIEPMFVSNPADCRKFSSVGGEAVGTAIAEAILSKI